MQNAALQHAGLPLRYELLDVLPEEVADTLRQLSLEGAGGNVTIPHKESVARLARCTALAARIGAVNTFWHEDGVLVGHNTDVAGAVAVIDRLRPQGLANMRTTVLGAGGSAAAALVAITTRGGGDIVLTSRTPARAQDLVERLGMSVQFAASAEDAVAGAGLIVNATPIGMTGEDVPVDVSVVSPGAALFDLVYRPGETAWIRQGRLAGLVGLDGLPMLLEQGASAFECWFDAPAPRDVMQRALAPEFVW